MSSRLATAGIVGLALSLQAAAAADLTEPAPQAAPFAERPTPYAAPAWQGFYAGSHVGYAVGNVETESGGTSVSYDLDKADSTTSGALAGWNFQSGRFVYGLEGVVSVHEIKAGYNGGAITAHDGDYIWSAEARARLGYDAGRFLPFVTGGLVVGEFYNSAQAGVDGEVETVTGFTLGAGVDMRVWRNWLVRAEYVYQNFGEQDYTLANAGTTLESAFDVHMARVALISHLGDPFRGQAGMEAGDRPLFSGPSFGVHAGYAAGEVGLGNHVSGSVDVDGAALGVHAGYLFPLGNLRLGLEKELTFHTTSGSAAPAPLTSFEYDLMWHAAVRAKVGYVYNRFMPYVTAGANLGQFTTRTQPGNATGVDPYKTGYSLGGGLKYAISDSLSLDLNYSYNRYDETSFGVGGGNTVDADLEFHQIRLGLSVR